ncbi:MAG: DUF357 domain-containing protein [Thermoproteota archaeon]
MSLEKLVSKYITSTEQVLKEMEILQKPINIDKEEVEEVLKYVEAYFQDAKYYKEEYKLKVSLTSIAYCEGLLDALKLLGAVKFEWSPKKEKR